MRQGSSNALGHKDPDQVLSGVTVRRFNGKHPPAMAGFPFDEYKTEVGKRGEDEIILRKNW